MKKVLFIILGFVLTLAVACEKDDDGTKYSQDKLNGTWENVEKDDDGCTNQIIITATSMKEKTICTLASTTVDYDSYAFDGKKITVTAMGIPATFDIVELTDNKLVLNATVLGTSEKSEYERVE